MGEVEHLHGHHMSPEFAHEVSKLGMWLFLATELLLFGVLFATYTIFRAQYTEMFHEQHLELDRTIGAINTVVLIASSLTMACGVASIQRGKQKLLALFLLLTILGGIIFGINKYFEYGAKFEHHIYPGTSLFFSLYFMMTGLHMLHVFGGVLILTVMLVLTLKGKFSAKYYTPVELGGLYWHLVDLIWIYLFPLFYLIG
ncbi:MAG TPA: cytochrome c oxidase subunit 3 family protein [Thermodesulfobacteriota bacterium]|nr:cytochrome c oxidase subunit 3 family protein [Thermodesulfobacteriota bacterium]